MPGVAEVSSVGSNFVLRHLPNPSSPVFIASSEQGKREGTNLEPLICDRPFASIIFLNLSTALLVRFTKNETETQRGDLVRDTQITSDECGTQVCVFQSLTAALTFGGWGPELGDTRACFSSLTEKSLQEHPEPFPRSFESSLAR